MMGPSAELFASVLVKWLKASHESPPAPYLTAVQEDT